MKSKGGKNMLKTNKEKVVKWSVQGKIHHPLGGGYRITHEGIPMILPATGGISYNVKIGDSAFGWAGDHVLICFEEDVLENLAIDDKIMIKAYGQGLKLEEYNDVKLMNIDPDLFKKLEITEKYGKLQLPVVAKVPPYLMGSRIGFPSAFSC